MADCGQILRFLATHPDEDAAEEAAVIGLEKYGVDECCRSPAVLYTIRRNLIIDERRRQERNPFQTAISLHHLSTSYEEADFATDQCTHAATVDTGFATDQTMAAAPSDEISTPCRTLVAAERSEALAALMEIAHQESHRLPELEQRVFWMRLKNPGISYREIGDLLGITAGHARTLNCRAADHLSKSVLNRIRKESPEIIAILTEGGDDNVNTQ